jgi:hypothetical protein
MSMRRFTRLTNAFSKKVENHFHALALYFVWYNFCRIQRAFGSPRRWRPGSATLCAKWNGSQDWSMQRRRSQDRAGLIG